MARLARVVVPGYPHHVTQWGNRRLVEVKDGDNVVLKCEYDGLGRRTKKFVNTSDPLDQTYDEYLHFFYNSGWQILETRRSGSENDPPESENPEVQYVWSRRYIDAPVLRDRDVEAGGDLGKSGSGLDQRLYYTTDANMNVTALLDTAGDAVERYSCDPYGRVTVYSDDWSTTVDWDDSKKNPVRYCGYFFDNETGLYCVRYRYYVPLLGRWLQRDRIGYADGMGLYEYVRSMPCNATDAYGERSLPESGLGSIGDSGHNGSDSRQACRFASVPEASECCETQEPVEMRRRGGPSLTPKPPPLPVNYGPGGTCAAGCHSPPRGLGSQYGWEAGLLVGVGQSTVCCCDECNYIRIMHFDKVCLGGIAGASVGAGVVAGIDGESCRAESYEGWFSEWGVTAGLVGASANVGMERPDFLSPTGVVETQGNAGVGAKAKVFVFCKYSLIKETILSSEDAKRRCQSRH